MSNLRALQRAQAESVQATSFPRRTSPLPLADKRVIRDRGLAALYRDSSSTADRQWKTRAKASAQLDTTHQAGGLQTSTQEPRRSGRDGDSYYVSEEDILKFKEQGFVALPQVLTDEELAEEVDPVYDAFLAGKIKVFGRDLCDMSGAKGRTPDQFTVFNAMLPRTYYPTWQGNLFERRCKAIADQLQGGDMDIDYDQILAKRPTSEDAIFAWHQDMAYWPPFVSSPETATCWLAVTDSTVENGCMRFVAGSHTEPELRPHSPVGASREDSHALYTTVKPEDDVVYVPLKRGDITVHNERVVHGSGPNMSSGWRKAYVLAFRKEECIAEERSYGFTHSHEDEFNWDVFHGWDEKKKQLS